MSQELTTVEESRYLPALSITHAITRRDAMIDFVKQIMVSGVDYATIPGTPKDTLLKPGAEKLCSFFGLTPDFELMDKAEDWNADEPLFYYRYKCRLLRDGRVIGDGEGSCNSRETKYRYRESKRICPDCGQPAIIKGKAEYGGGWLCFAKKGGCGAKYMEGDSAIEGQQIGRVTNPDIFDQINTIQKMSQKRALIAATLIAVNASEYFTQDLDELQTIGPPVPTVDTELLEGMRFDLAAARDRLRTLGGEPPVMTARQAAAMTARELSSELANTNQAVWDLVVIRLADAPKPEAADDLFPDDDQAELDAAVDAATAKYKK